MAGHQVLVLRIGVRIPAPQRSRADARGAARDADARRGCGQPSGDASRSGREPPSIVMAAGQGTRMRSSDPEGAARRLRAADGALARARRAARPAPSASSSSTPRRGRSTGAARRASELAVQPRARRHRRRGRPPACEARRRPTRAVVVLSGDVPLSPPRRVRALVDAHADAGAAATMVTTMLDDPSGYGRVVRDADGGVERVVETKAAGDATAEELAIREVNTGIYVLRRRGAARRRSPRLRLRQRAGRAATCPTSCRCCAPTARRSPPTSSTTPRSCSGVNDRVAARPRSARSPSARIHRRPHALAGVTVVDPAVDRQSTSTSRSAQDTVIEPFTVLRGATRIGEGCTIGPNATLRDTTIGDGVTRPALLRRRRRAPRRREGRAVRLPAPRQPCCATARRSGTFVEVKNSDIGAGAKVPHLSYIGDADVGERHEPRRGHDHRQLRRARQAPHDDRHARARRRRHVSFVAPVTRRRRRLHGARARSSPTTCPTGALGDRPRAADEHRGLRRAQERRS